MFKLWRFLGVTLLLSLPAVLTAAPASRQSLQDLQQRIETLKQEMDRTEGAHAEASDALKESEQAISEANRKLNDLSAQQKESASALERLRKDRGSLEQTITKQQSLLANQLYQQYLGGEQNYLRSLLQQQDPATLARDLEYYRYVAKARAALITDLRRNLGHVAAMDAQTESSLKEIATLKTAQAKEKTELQKQQTARKQVLVKLATQLKSQRGEITRLQRDEKRLSQLVEKLARIVPPPRKPESTGKSATPEKGPRNEALPSPELDGNAFASLKGKLHLPARGEVTGRFGAPREDSGISWKGLFIKASEGEHVHAVASGRVVFADWLRGFGNLLILDHGGGYMSLYGNNQALLKRVGDDVKAGDSVAAVGNSGGNEISGVYFELRKQSRPFDPLAWCSLN